MTLIEMSAEEQEQARAEHTQIIHDLIERGCFVPYGKLAEVLSQSEYYEIVARAVTKANRKLVE